MGEEVRRPLTGIKVLEMSAFVAVPATARFLCDMGAEVIKIESSKGDGLRYTGLFEGRPFDQHENTSFDMQNGGKKCIVLDVRTDEGKKVLAKLLDWADVFLCNWRPAAMKRAGIDYETLHKKYPSLVFGNLTGYGEKGPDKDLPGFDYTAFFARGGLSVSLPQKDTYTLNSAPGLGDLQGGMMLAAGVCAALYRAKVYGIGDKVSVNLMHAAIFTQGMAIQTQQYHGKYGQDPYPFDRRHNSNPFAPSAKSKDGHWITICASLYSRYFPSMMKAIGREDLIDDPVLSNLDELHKSGRTPEVYDLWQKACGTKNVDEWKKILTKLDVPFGVCQTWDEVIKDPQAWANDCFVKFNYPRGEKVMVRYPVDLADTPLKEYHKASLLGGDTIEVMKEFGYSDDQIKHMLDDKTIMAEKKDD